MSVVTTIKDCFANERVNLGRQSELDLGRAIPVFCLPFVHTVIECTPVERIDEPIPWFFNILIGQPFGAPMFIFAMGACLLYTRHSDAKSIQKRGLILFLAGFLLNFCRFVVPYLIGYAITGETEKFIDPIFYKWFGNDILQFAGLSMMLLGTLIGAHVSNVMLLVIAGAMSIFGSLVRHVDFGITPLNIALGHFIGTQEDNGFVMSDFPLMNWFILPVCGYLFGKVLLHLKDKVTFYKIVSPVIIIAYTIFFVWECMHDIGQVGKGATLVDSENAYYHILWYDVLGFIIFDIGVLGLWYYLMNHFPKWLFDFCTALSRNITRVYVIHWIFVTMLTNVVFYVIRGTQEMPIGPTLLLSAVILAFTFPLALLWEKKSRERKERKG